MLTAAPRTRDDLARSLRQRGTPEDVVSRVLDRFVELALVDDSAYAASYVASRQRTRGLGRRALTAELRQRGVEEGAVAAAVAEISDDDERERAAELVRKRLPSLERFDRPTQERRLVGMLARKGYAAGIAYSVVRTALDGDS